MHLLSVATPSLLDNYERKIKYINTNGLIRDLEQFEIERKEKIIWSEKEKNIFAEKFAQYPKWFEKIASYLEVKTGSDCVVFYYLNKKKHLFHSSKLKKKKGKLTRAGGIALNQNKPKQNKQGKDDVDVELEEDDEEDSVDGDDDTANALNTQSVEGTAENKAKPETDSKIINPIAETPVVIEAPVIADKLPKQKPVLPTKIFNTRSGKFLPKTTVAPPTKIIVAEPAEDKTIIVQSTADQPHPPLKITIVVTSPSNTEGQLSAISVASIVSETVTAASMMAETTTTTSLLPVVICESAPIMTTTTSTTIAVATTTSVTTTAVATTAVATTAVATAAVATAAVATAAVATAAVATAAVATAAVATAAVATMAVATTAVATTAVATMAVATTAVATTASTIIMPIPMFNVEDLIRQHLSKMPGLFLL